MSTRRRYDAQWAAFCKVLRTKKRPATFEDAYGLVAGGVSGLYEMEARALWNILRKEKITRAAEIGRNLGGTLFLLACCCRDLQEMLSIDVFEYENSDRLFPGWFSRQGITLDMRRMNSAELKPEGVYDFVFIDGEHTGPGVKADIEAWKDHARIIAFHDFADHGHHNSHRRVYPGVIAEIKAARKKYNWEWIPKRGRSDIAFRTKNQATAPAQATAATNAGAPA